MFRIGIVIAFIACLSSCETVSRNDSHLGVYKITERRCNGSHLQLQACETIEFIEFVKGNFYKIDDDELAFVVWSGESDLNYSARKLNQKLVGSDYPVDIVISRDPNASETVRLNSQNVGVYILEAKGITSVLNFRLASSDDLEPYVKIYPGNM